MYFNKSEIKLIIEIYDEENTLLESKFLDSIKSASNNLLLKIKKVKKLLKDKISFKNFILFLKRNQNLIHHINIIVLGTQIFVCCGPSNNVDENNLEQQIEKLQSKDEHRFNTEYVANHSPTIPTGSNAMKFVLVDENGNLIGTDDPNYDVIASKYKNSANTQTGFMGSETDSAGNINIYNLDLVKSYSGEGNLPATNFYKKIKHLINDKNFSIFYYNNAIESQLSDLVQQIIIDFNTSDVKSKTYKEKITFNNKTINTYYMVVENWADATVQNALQLMTQWELAIKATEEFKSLDRKNRIKYGKIIEEGADKIRSCVTQETLEGGGKGLGGYVCSAGDFDDPIFNKFGFTSPTFIQYNSISEIENTIKHETGHMVYDSKFLANTVNSVMKRHEGKTFSKEEFFINVIRQFSLIKNNKSIRGKSYRLTVDELPAFAKKRISGFLNHVFSLMLSSGEIELLDDDNIKILTRKNDYMSRHNEFIQHHADRVRSIKMILKSCDLTIEEVKMFSDIYFSSHFADNSEREEIVSLYRDRAQRKRFDVSDDLRIFLKKLKEDVENYEKKKKDGKRKKPKASDLSKGTLLFFKKLMVNVEILLDKKFKLEDLSNYFNVFLKIGKNYERTEEIFRSIEQLAFGHKMFDNTQEEIRSILNVIYSLAENSENTTVGSIWSSSEISDTDFSEFGKIIFKSLKIDKDFLDYFMKQPKPVRDWIKESLTREQISQMNKIAEKLTGLETTISANENFKRSSQLKEKVYRKILSNRYNVNS